MRIAQERLKKTGLFTQCRRRARVRALVTWLAAFTAMNMCIIAAKAEPGVDPSLFVMVGGQQDALDRLVSPPGLVGDQMAKDGRGTYKVVGGAERFVFERKGRQATIQFLCAKGAKGCTGGAHPLIADQAGRGDVVFKSEEGVAVLRITATGGATLLGGASFVPGSVPRDGRAVVPGA